MEANQEEANAFANVFFCDRDIEPEHTEIKSLNDSLDGSERVVKKGSFKVLRPRTSFSVEKELERNEKPGIHHSEAHADKYNEK